MCSFIIMIMLWGGTLVAAPQQLPLATWRVHGDTMRWVCVYIDIYCVYMYTCIHVCMWCTADHVHCTCVHRGRKPKRLLAWRNKSYYINSSNNSYSINSSNNSYSINGSNNSYHINGSNNNYYINSSNNSLEHGSMTSRAVPWHDVTWHDVTKSRNICAFSLRTSAYG